MTGINGKLVLRSIPNEDVAKKVFAFVCANAQNVSPEIVAAKLKKLPMVLASSITPQAGGRAVQSLAEMGADAVFVPGAPHD